MPPRRVSPSVWCHLETRAKYAYPGATSIAQCLPFVFVTSRRNDVADDGDGVLHGTEHRATVHCSRRRNYFSHGLAVAGNANGFASAAHFFEQRQAFCLEFGDRDFNHGYHLWAY